MISYKKQENVRILIFDKPEAKSQSKVQTPNFRSPFSFFPWNKGESRRHFQLLEVMDTLSGHVTKCSNPLKNAY